MPATDTPETRPTPAALIEGLERLLRVEELDTDLYRGLRNPGGQGRVFGGQVIAQALMSASASVEPDRIAHSLHAYFMRPGDENLPIICRVERDFDGRSFSTRRVIAMQKGKPILNLAASFQVPEEGFTHQAQMPDVPQPEDLLSEAELIERERSELPEAFVRVMTRPRPIEMRPVRPWSILHPDKREPERHIWMRAVAPVSDDPVMHRAVLAYASDMALLSTSMQPHGVSWISGKMQAASLDHALWMHEDVRADEWMLYVTDSPWAGGGRGFNRGQIFARDGRLIASTAQEGLIRQR
ncbi:MAG: acyl-CoA thioesterase-2 [Maricaulis sp.]|jgi:acyl-CoA thioesterase-2